MLEVPWNFTSLLCDKGWHCAVVEALTQHGINPTSPPIIWKVVDNFHMLWMGSWDLYHANTTTCVDPDVGSQLESLSLLVLGNTRCHCAMVEALTQHGMVPSSPHIIYQALDNVHMLWMGTWIYHNAVTNTCVHPDVGSLPKYYHCWVTKEVIVQWLRVLTNMESIPHPLPTYARYLTTFICCGWAHGTFIMWLPLHVFIQMWEVQWNPASLLGYKGYHCAVVEALTQDGRVLTSPSNIWKVFENLHMLWMGTWIYHNAVTTICVNPDLGS